MKNKIEKLDLNQLKNLRKIRSRVGAEFVEDLIEIFASTTKTNLQTLREALDLKNTQAIIETAHFLKDTSSNMGAHYMAAICLELESLGKLGQIDGKFYDLVETLEREFNSTLIELRQAG